MPYTEDKDFTQEEIDQQIERYLPGESSTPEDAAAQRTIQSLKHIYQVKSDEHAPSLERVWNRVLASEMRENTQSAKNENEQAQADEPDNKQQDAMLPIRFNGQSKIPGRASRARTLLAQLVAVLCLVLIVGSVILANNLSHHPQLTSLNIQSGDGLYAYMDQSVYRLDDQTHQILWKHSFASDEVVQTGVSVVNDPDTSFVVHGILYVEILKKTESNKQYLIALSIANGSVLWQQPSARAFANSTAIYTLVESKTSNVSTLTARDLQTGGQLWQRQYPIVGSKNDPGRGTDDTEGFRLITVTDQVLYAVASYDQAGQKMFARYGLNPKNGSIIWQNHDVIVGRMPVVEAQIVDGVVYTAEYNLKSVSPYTDSHGMYVDEIPQSQVAAYNATTGTNLWKTQEMVGEEPNGGFYLTASSTMLYYQTYNQDWPANARVSNSITTLHALNVSDGSLSWQHQTKSGGITGAVLEGNSLYFETSQYGTIADKLELLHLSVVALNAQTGDVRWSAALKLLDGTEKTPTPVPNDIDPDFSSGYTLDMAPVASQDTVYYSTPGSRVYALRPSDGKILSQFWVDKTSQTTVLDRARLFVAQ